MNISKAQAKKLLAAGARLIHSNFSDTEWITQRGCMIITEEGYMIDQEIFWSDRSSSGWDYGWSVTPWKDLEVNKMYEIISIEGIQNEETGEELLFFFTEQGNWILVNQYITHYHAINSKLYTTAFEGEEEMTYFPNSFTLLEIGYDEKKECHFYVETSIK